jgi:hypothetical protein
VKELSASITRDGASLVLTCSGAAETGAFATLATLLGEVHDRMVADAMRVAVADLRTLDFASSSCLKAFVTWLQRVQMLDAHRQYTVKFLASSRHAWQSRSLQALAAFAGSIVQIEMDAP